MCMTAFDLVFAMFGLVLGLAVTEVLGGFARVLKMRRKAHIGWLTPLLGVYVLLDLTTFWMTAWALRDLVPATLLTLFAVLVLVGGYYLVATLIFPDNPDEWPDFDLYYDEHNRVVLGFMLATNIALMVLAMGLVAYGLQPAGAPSSGKGGVLLLLAGLLPMPLLIALIIVKARKVNVVLLMTLIVLWIMGAVAPVL
jgi:hypothetical protein